MELKSRRRPWDSLSLLVGLVILILIGLLAHLIWFVPSLNSCTAFDADQAQDDAVGLKDRILCFPANAVTATIVGSEAPGERFARIEVTRNPVFSGVTLWKTASVPPTASVQITWRAKGETIRTIQVDLRDGSPGAEVDGQSEVFSTFAPLPPRNWATQIFPFSLFRRNPHQPTTAPKDGVLDTDPMLGMNLVCPPGTELQLDIKRIDFVWGEAQPPVMWLLGLLVVLGSVVLVRPPSSGQALGDLPLLSSSDAVRMVYLLVSGALAFWALTARGRVASQVEFLLFLGLLALLLWDTLKPAPVWRWRIFRVQYALLVLLSFAFGAHFEGFTWFLLLLAGFVPILQWRDRTLFGLLTCAAVADILVGPLIWGDPQRHGYVWVVLVPPLLVVSTWEMVSHQRAVSQSRSALSMYEKLFESSVDAIYQLDSGREIEDVNDGFERLVGLPKNRIVGVPVLQFIHPEDRERFQLTASRGFEGEAQDIELRWLRHDGEVRAVLLSERSLEGGPGSAGYLGIAHDITERLRAERVIRESEERYRSLYASMREGVALHTMQFDDQGKGLDYTILEVNPAFERILGIPADSVIDRPASEAYGTGTAPYLEAYAEVVRTGKPLRFETTFEPMGKTFAISAFKLSKGRFATVFEDITSQRRMEAELRQAQKMEAIGQLAGGVAHDFNNLLQAIVGHTDLALSTLEPTHPACQDLDQVQRASDRAVSLTRQLLAFSRRQEINPEVVNLNGIIEDVIKMLRRLIGEQITLELTLSSLPLTILADRGMIEQVLMNLCVNARDAISGPGTISISTFLVDSRGKRANHAGAPFVNLRVRDSGCGIAPEELEHVFEPFYTTKETGTGLGLATVYGIIRQHKGTVSVRSRPGAGTSFDIRLSRATGTESTQPGSARVSASGGSETLLVAEDEPGVREMVRRLLERNGYTVCTAVDGYEAVRIAQERLEAIDMMILDMVMPGLNGLDVLRRVHRDMPDMPVLFCTGYSPELLGEGASLIPEGCLIKKPYSPAHLLERVRRILDEAAANLSAVKEDGREDLFGRDS